MMAWTHNPGFPFEDLACGTAGATAHDVWYLSGDEWRAGFLQAANAGWSWTKSWRLWVPPHDADGLRELDDSVRHEMSESMGVRYRSAIILATDADFLVPWFGDHENRPVESLTFAAFSRPAQGLKH